MNHLLNMREMEHRKLAVELTFILVGIIIMLGTAWNAYQKWRLAQLLEYFGVTIDPFTPIHFGLMVVGLLMTLGGIRTLLRKEK